MCDKIDGFIKIYDGTRYLILIVPEKYDAVLSRPTTFSVIEATLK